MTFPAWLAFLLAWLLGRASTKGTTDALESRAATDASIAGESDADVDRQLSEWDRDRQ
jgi:hypothetical protein